VWAIGPGLRRLCAGIVKAYSTRVAKGRSRLKRDDADGQRLANAATTSAPNHRGASVAVACLLGGWGWFEGSPCAPDLLSRVRDRHLATKLTCLTGLRRSMICTG